MGGSDSGVDPGIFNRGGGGGGGGSHYQKNYIKKKLDLAQNRGDAPRPCTPPPPQTRLCILSPKMEEGRLVHVKEKL